jgi:hypothetical protein
MYGTRTLFRSQVIILRFPFSGRNSTMTVVDIVATLLDSLGITVAQIRALLGL